jgi:hypothetical protein
VDTNTDAGEDEVKKTVMILMSGELSGKEELVENQIVSGMMNEMC